MDLADVDIVSVQRFMKCLCVFLLRNQLKLKINRLTAKLLQVLNSISSTPCKTGENGTAAVLDMMPLKGGWCLHKLQDSNNSSF